MGLPKSSNKGTLNAVGTELLQYLPQNSKPWYKTGHLIRLNLILLVPLFSSAIIGFDGSMMNGLQSLKVWKAYFHNPEAALLGAINALYIVGKLLGLFPATFLSDKYGRRMPMYVAFVLLLIGTVLQGAAQNVGMMIAARFVLGFGTAFLAQPSPVLVTELAYPTHRGRVTALYNTFYFVGGILAAWTTYATFKMTSNWGWRIPSIMQGAFPFLQFLGFFWLPESPRWLVSQGRITEARAFLVKYHTDNDETSPLVDFELREMEESIEMESHVNSKSSYLDLFRTPANRRRSLIAAILGIFTQWSGNAVISYYLTLVLNTVGITATSTQTLLNGMLQIFNWFSAVCGGALMVDRMGRRTLFLISASGMLTSYVCWTILNSVFVNNRNIQAGHAVIAFLFIYNFFYAIAYTPLNPAYVVEIYPSLLRSRGVTWAYSVNYCGLIIGNFCNPIALKKLGWKYYIVFCILLSISIVLIYFLFPETRGRSLEEIAEIFDGSPQHRRDGGESGTDWELKNSGGFEAVEKKLAREHVERISSRS